MITISINGGEDVFISIDSNGELIGEPEVVKHTEELEYPKEEVAEVAFNAYGDKANWKTFDGREMPKWGAVGDDVQQRWVAAIEAVVKWFDIRPA